MELKARFDEQNNISWARALENAGVHVVYGLVGLKTHAKMCLVVRREADGTRSYAHVGTGNYNPATARIYTDLGYFTCESAVVEDIADLFNSLTGYSRKTDYLEIFVSPNGIRDAVLMRIEREIERQRTNGDGHIAFKMNALVDRACIDALYRASQEGVRVELQVRGICCLRPEVPGLSEGIRVTSIVGRFLEHARIYWFRNGGDEEVCLSSADLMPRNLDHRVELMLPVHDSFLRTQIREILFLHLRDNVNARRLKGDGTWSSVVPREGESRVDSQEQLLKGSPTWHRDN